MTAMTRDDGDCDITKPLLEPYPQPDAGKRIEPHDRRILVDFVLLRDDLRLDDRIGGDIAAKQSGHRVARRAGQVECRFWQSLKDDAEIVKDSEPVMVRNRIAEAEHHHG